MVCLYLTECDEHVAAQADSSMPNKRASLSRSLATDLNVESQIWWKIVLE